MQSDYCKPIIVTSLLLVLSSHTLAGSKGHDPIARMDTDGDNLISLEEFSPPGHRRFEKADANGDGSVTLEELQEQVANRENKRKNKRAERLESHFTEMDLNQDGMVTSDEAKTAIFSKIDADQDGFLTEDELRQAHKGMRKHHGKHPRRHEDET